MSTEKLYKALTCWKMMAKVENGSSCSFRAAAAHFDDQGSFRDPVLLFSSCLAHKKWSESIFVHQPLRFLILHKTRRQQWFDVLME